MGSLVGRFSFFANNMPETVSTNNYDDSIGLQESPEAIVLDFNKFMRDNVENIRDIQQQSLAQQFETNEAVRSQGLQINRLRHQVQDRTLMLKDAIVEASEVSQRQVEELRLEVNHFREQFNLRMEQLEVDLEASRGRENQRAVQAMDLAQDQTHVNGEIVHTLSELATVLTANVMRHPQPIENTPVAENSLQVITNSNPQPGMDVQDETPVISNVTGQSRSGRIIKKRELSCTSPSPKCSSNKKPLTQKCPHCGRILKTITGMRKHVEKYCPALK